MMDAEDELRQRQKDTKVFTSAFSMIDIDKSGRVDAHDVMRLIKAMGQVLTTPLVDPLCLRPP